MRWAIVVHAQISHLLLLGLIGGRPRIGCQDMKYLHHSVAIEAKLPSRYFHLIVYVADTSLSKRN